MENKKLYVGDKVKIQFPAFEVEYTVRNGYPDMVLGEEVCRIEMDKMKPINSTIEELFNKAFKKVLSKHFNEQGYDIFIGGQTMVGVPMNISVYKRNK